MKMDDTRITARSIHPAPRGTSDDNRVYPPFNLIFSGIGSAGATMLIVQASRRSAKPRTPGVVNARGIAAIALAYQMVAGVAVTRRHEP